MTHHEARWIRILVQDSAGDPSSVREGRVRLPLDASVSDLLEALRRTESPLYHDVRLRILRLSGEVLAFGKGSPQLVAIREALASGGPVMIPTIQEEEPSLESSLRA